MKEGFTHKKEAPKHALRSPLLAAAVLAATATGPLSSAAEATSPQNAKRIEYAKHTKPEKSLAPQHGLRGILAKLLMEGKTSFLTPDFLPKVMANAEREFSIPPGRRIIENSLARMAPYEAQLKEIFAAHGVPEWCLYLVIVESGFDVDRESTAGATGVFQFTFEAGKTAKLVRTEYDAVTKTKKVVDERKDILKSGEAAAKLLSYNYRIHVPKAATDQDAWLLAVAQYNGSFSYHYAMQEHSQTSYAGFAQYMDGYMHARVVMFRHAKRPSDTWESLAKKYFVGEARLREVNNGQLGGEVLIPEIDTADLWYDVKSGESPSRIAETLGTSTARLIELNPETLKPNTLFLAGIRLRIPPEARNAQALAAKLNILRMEGLPENAEYVLKLLGVLSILKKQGVIKGPVPRLNGGTPVQ